MYIMYIIYNLLIPIAVGTSYIIRRVFIAKKINYKVFDLERAQKISHHCDHIEYCDY